MRKTMEKRPEENPVYHSTYKLLKNYRDVRWSLELAVQQVRASFQLEDVEGILEKLRPHIRNISRRTYYRRRNEAVEILSSVLWGYTSRNNLELLEQFFPDE